MSIRRLLTIIFWAGMTTGPTLAGEPAGGESTLGAHLPLWSILPFVGILLSIALFPLTAPHFWHRRFPAVSAFWGLVFGVPFLWACGAPAFSAILHTFVLDYVPFLILLWGLYTVAGGIVLRGHISGTPAVNTALLATGTLLASWIGTTGAAMVLIRPLLRANAARQHKIHSVVFFIFLVANIGGALTPLGDPPLFLGFLHGVPFLWTSRTLILPLLFCLALLLPIYYFIDRRAFRRESPAVQAAIWTAPEDETSRRIRLAGSHNLLYLAGIIAAVLLSGLWHGGTIQWAGLSLTIPSLARDGLILILGGLSLRTTPRALRRENEFSWGPIREVAILFAGIFVTMIPALAILRAGEQGAMSSLVQGVDRPWHFFWASGLLSSFLDNAPTYLTFFSSALGKFSPGMAEPEALAQLLQQNPIYLAAISAGSVFMGANSYIGNAPNFMVKSIAEESGLTMPSFFGYIFRWSLLFLIPTFLLTDLIFF